jgi:hypothetical protein
MNKPYDLQIEEIEAPNSVTSSGNATPFTSLQGSSKPTKAEVLINTLPH